MKIGIAGCGIAGTSAGIFLARAGHDVTIFEQASECRPVGAGILLQPSGQAILRQLGLLEQVASRSARLDGLEARLASGRRLIRLKYADLHPDDYGLGVHRGFLFAQLLATCHEAGVQVVTDSPVTDVRFERNRARFQLADRQWSESFDFVIAVDGARSRLREVSGIPCTGKEYEYAALWTTGPLTSIQDRLFQVIDGTKRLVGLLPIGHGEASFFWGLRRDQHQQLTRQRDWESFQREVVQLCPQAEELLQHVDGWESLIFATYRHVRMKRWWTNRMIFLGDAAHPTSPHLGQGVNLALEDAACFTRSLETEGEFEQACRSFTKQRKSKLRYYQAVTRLLTPFFQSGSSILATGRNLCLPVMPRLPFVGSTMLQTLRGTRNGWLR